MALIIFMEELYHSLVAFHFLGLIYMYSLLEVTVMHIQLEETILSILLVKMSK